MSVGFPIDAMRELSVDQTIRCNGLAQWRESLSHCQLPIQWPSLLTWLCAIQIQIYFATESTVTRGWRLGAFMQEAVKWTSGDPDQCRDIELIDPLNTERFYVAWVIMQNWYFVWWRNNIGNVQTHFGEEEKGKKNQCSSNSNSLKYILKGIHLV